jgi:4-hydroxy-2-oxoheptanedioate aldolase
MTTHTAAWFSTPHFAGVEIAAQLGFDALFLDVEHGTFGLEDLNRIIPFSRALGLTTYVKTGAAERAAIQQALDFGADGVIIPHVFDVNHAREVSSFARLPPLGDRSLAGGRTMSYAGFDEKWSGLQNSKTLCLPMIEHPEAFDDLAAILALPSVDGVFVGPGDLFARRGGGGYRVTDDDLETIRRIADAASAAGKIWMMPAWSETEQRLAASHGAHTVGLIQEFTALRRSMGDALSNFRAFASE